MDRAEFERVVDDVLETLPQWIVDRVDNVQVVVEEWPTREQDSHGHGLLGLYEGISLLDRGVDYFAAMPDTIYIFRQPHLQLGLSDPELRAEIRKTVLHELGHHLGIDDARMHEIGYE
jgi:predicted Zn-dependent protease with MMP-like domain